MLRPKASRMRGVRYCLLKASLLPILPVSRENVARLSCWLSTLPSIYSLASSLARQSEICEPAVLVGIDELWNFIS